MLEIHIATIFPNYFKGPFSETIIKRAIEKGKIKIVIHNLRDYTKDKHRQVDDKPYGGGAGMLLKVEPFYNFLFKFSALPAPSSSSFSILTSAKGELFDQTFATSLLGKERIFILCGRYEGVDQRVADHLVDREVSIGNYVLSGGEPAAIVIVDTITRLIPGVLGNAESLNEETFSDQYTGKAEVQSKTMEYPQYTKPAIFKTRDGKIWDVPEVLRNGNHEKIREWRKSKMKKLDD